MTRRVSTAMVTATTIVDVLRSNADNDPHRVAFSFRSEHGGAQPVHLTAAVVDERARRVAGALTAGAARGDRVLLFVPPGAGYLAAVAGCLYAGMCAVPVEYAVHAGGPPGPPFVAIGRDAGISAVLTVRAAIPAARQAWRAAGAGPVTWIAVDDPTLEPADGPVGPVSPEDLAVLLYTSGSTGEPKGVMTSHGNIMAALAALRSATGLPAGADVVCWLPLHHGLGLIGQALFAQYVGGQCHVLRTAEAVARPAGWLEAITAAAGPVLSGGPSFMYDRCVTRIADHELAGLDLAGWHTALNGAERIRKDTIERFTARFGRCGFQPTAMFPIYGLTETTLIVSAGRVGRRLGVTVDRTALEAGQARAGAATGPGPAGVSTLVSCGRAGLGTRVAIVEPDTRLPVADGEVGEVWVQGPSTTLGYWRREEETSRVFGACLATGEGPFLRTGDLAFRHRGELIVCGRRKELMIIRGRNIHPQDVELTAASVLASPGPAAAFSVEGPDGERLVLVQSVAGPAPSDAETVAAALRHALTEAHRVDAEVVLTAAGSIPLTAAGKVRRRACREEYRSRRLTPLAVSRPSRASAPAEAGVAPAVPPRATLLEMAPQARLAAVSAVLSARLASALGAEVAGDADVAGGAEVAGQAQQRDGDGPRLASLGLDSLRALSLVHQLSGDFGVPISLSEVLPARAGEVARTIAGRLSGDGAGHDTAGQDGAVRDAAGPAWPRAIQADPAGRFEPFPLTDLQSAYVAGRSGSYEVGTVSAHYYREIEGAGLDLPRLEQSLERLVERHEMLRAVVSVDGSQRILPYPPEPGGPGRPHIVWYAAGHLAGQELDEHIGRVRADLSHQVLPLGERPLFELRVTRLAGGRARLHLSIDLLIADVRSIQIFFDDWHLLYLHGDLPALAPEISFRDYIIGVSAGRPDAGYEQAKAYWAARIPSLPAGPQLPVTSRPAAEAARFFRLEQHLPVRDWERVKERAARYGVTPSAVLLAAYAVVLAAWSRTGHFLLNIPMFNRLPLHERIDEVIGDFTTLILLEVNVTGQPGIAALAEQVQRQLLSDMDHRQFSGVEVLRELARSRRELAGTPAPVVFASARGQGPGHLSGDWLGETVCSISQTPQVWIDHQVYEKDGELIYNWDSVEGLFPAGVVEEMFGAYCGVLAGLAGGAGWESGVGCVLPGWQRELVAGANDTGGVVAAGMLFEPLVGWAVAEPGRDAVWAGGRWLSYGELYARACGLARTLRGLGVGPGQPVAVSVGKSAEQVVAVLGVLLAGGAYLPVDPGLPEPRQDHLVGHGRARVVVAAAGGRRVWASGVRCVPVDMAGPADLGAGPPEQVGSADDLAYIIYTSGSTGAPKGVAVSHRAAANTCADVCARFGVTGADRVLGLSSLSFDLSVWDIFGVLGAGGGLVLPEPAARRDPGRWAELVAEHKVTVWNSVPALMQMYVEHIAGRADAAGPRLVLLSGDWIPLELPGRLAAVLPGARLVSLGGATEAAIWSICHPVEQVEPGWESVPYGRPMAGQSFHVLNDRLEPCPVWVTGELYIGGAGLAEGYWQDPAKTAAAFITHPGTGQRLYRTGDLGRWRPGGVIEFLGREDFQVKIGGYRIELGEIEAAMLRHPRIHTALAVAAGERHHRHLAAYLYPDPATSRSPQTDQALLAETSTLLHGHLPAYMIPTTITILDQLPLTPNGKIDRTNLPNPHQPTTHQDTSGCTDAEELLLSIVKKAVGADPVGVTTNFFDLGLDSVVIVRIHRMICDELRQDFPLTLLFENPTIRALAGHLHGQGNSADDAAQAYARARMRRASSRRGRRRLPPGQEQE